MQPVLISADGLSKAYKIYSRPWERLWEAVGRRPRHQVFTALSQISFEVAQGESLGVIGENGAGKSTMLKLMAGVTVPSSGRLQVRGKVASLLELGMGFHQDFTGRQNIRLNAAMMGIPEEQIEAKTPEIIAFSELKSFIDRPVKTYSTGMAMRLGFAIAIHVDPEILIIDEALSVGDGYFQKKCMDAIQRYLESGRTLLFCSHALYYVSAYCKKAIWLKNGEMAAYGPVEEVVRDYENYLLARRNEPKIDEARQEIRPDEHQRPASGPARLLAVSLERGSTYRYGDPWTLTVEWKTSEPDLSFHIGVGIDRVDDVQVCSFGTHRDGLTPFVGAGQYRIQLLIPELTVLKGEFTLYVFLLDEKGLHVYDQKLLLSAFAIESDHFELGLMRIPHQWQQEGKLLTGSESQGV